jgi:hypothetical protein
VLFCEKFDEGEGTSPLPRVPVAIAAGAGTVGECPHVISGNGWAIELCDSPS